MIQRSWKPRRYTPKDFHVDSDDPETANQKCSLDEPRVAVLKRGISKIQPDIDDQDEKVMVNISKSNLKRLQELEDEPASDKDEKAEIIL